MEKLKALKVVLKFWNKEVFRNLDSRVDNFKEEVSRVDSFVDLRPLSAGEIENRSGVLVNMWSFLRIKDSQLVQRSRSKWFKEGDSSSDYFHASIKSIIRRNTILAFKVGEVWIEWVSDIRQEVVNHFTNIFRESNMDRPRLDDFIFCTLLINGKLSLSGPFSLQELDRAVSQCDGNKILGLDGFNFSFLDFFFGICS